MNWGHPQAQFHLGTMAEQGLGRAKNLKKALAWHRRAAHQGYIPSLNYVIQALVQGLGVPQNFPVAYRYILVLKVYIPHYEWQGKTEQHCLSQLSPEEIKTAKTRRTKILVDMDEHYHPAETDRDWPKVAPLP